MVPMRVLLAEDTPATQTLVRRTLGKHGHEVEIAPDGREAIEMASQGGFDLVLMDVQMPVVDGFQATAAIRAAQRPSEPRLPIVALTASEAPEDRQRCLDAGMDAFLSKPIDVARLVEVVERFAPGGAATVATSSPAAILPGATVSTFDYQAALARFGGLRELFQEMGEMFLADAPRLLAEIRAAYDAGDFRTVERTAHRLKGTAGYFGVPAAVEAARRVEQDGKREDREVLAPGIQALEREVDQLARAMIPWVKGDKGGA
jgi:two-component system, sensor histidine kinase and response regulator